MTGRTLPVGTRLQQGKYTVDRVLGQGGFGITYLATDTALRRPVAIKELFPPGCVRHANAVVLPNPPARLTATKFDRAKEKFLNEAQTLARFDHPGIVRVYTVFTENNTAYMVMKYLRGRTLGELLKANGGVLSEPEAVKYVDAIGQALGEVHKAKVVHRDVTPENVLVTDEGRTVVVDFGEAREFAADVTDTMEVVVKHGYAPLEQYGGGARGAFTDVYALGATLYRLLTGEVPVAAPDRFNGIDLGAPDGVNAHVSEKVSKAVMKSMAIGAADRHQSMDEFLNAFANREPPRPPPPAPAAPALTRGDGSCRATWANVGGATGYDVRWRQRGAWTHVPNAVSPRTIAALEKEQGVDVQVRAKNATGVSAWSPIMRLPGLPRPPPPGTWKRIVFGLALLAVIMIVVWSTAVTGRESPGAQAPPEGESDSTPSPLEQDDATSPDADGGARPSEGDDSTAPREEDGDLASPDGSAADPTERNYPRVESLVRRDPSDRSTNADSITWRITFSEPMRNVDAADFFVTGMGASWNLKVDGSGSVYNITLDSHALADQNAAVTLRVSSKNDITDVDGNGIVTVEPTGNHTATFFIDNTAPRVAGIVRLSPSGERAKAEISWQVTFNEPVQNVSADDFRITGTNASIVVAQERSSRGRFRVTASNGNLAGVDGNVTLEFDANQDIRDAAGNALTDAPPVTLGAKNTVSGDDAAPTVTFDPATARSDNAVRDLTLTFSEAVYRDSRSTPFTKLTLGELIDLRKNDERGDEIAFTASIDEDNDTVTIDPIGKLPVQTWLRVNDTYYDSLGHRGREETATFILEATRTLGTTRPTVKIDGVPATDSGAFMATFTFSEEITGFTASDVRVSNATASAFTEVQAGRRWYVRITPTGDDGVGGRDAIPAGIEVSHYGVWLPANQVTDLAGNGNTASSRHSGSYGPDVTDPRLLSIVRQAPSTGPAPADSVTWRVTLSEAVQHFGTSSVNLLEDHSDRVIRHSADRVTPVGRSESVYDVTFGGLADHTGRVRLNFQVRSDDSTYSAYIQDKAARSLLCCETIGTDERTFDLNNAPSATERRRGSYGDVSTRLSSEPELDTALRSGGGSYTNAGRAPSGR